LGARKVYINTEESQLKASITLNKLFLTPISNYTNRIAFVYFNTHNSYHV